MDKIMIPSNNQNELKRFLKILQVRLQEHQQACNNFLTQMQQPIAEMLHNHANVRSEPIAEHIEYNSGRRS
jgi:hypothetical protein